MPERPDYSQCVGDSEAVRKAFEECFDVKFVHKVFSVQPMLETIMPDEFGNFYAIPYTGEDYIRDDYELVEDGWDHEHCYICFQAIRIGDEYWANERPGICPDLCTFCYEELQNRLRAALKGGDV